MTISVTPITDTSTNKVTGWTVTKDGQKYTITDTNGDGIFNKGDLIDCAEGTTPLSAEDIFNVSYNVQLQENGGKGVSAEDMAQYAEYQKAAEERDAAQADYELAQRKAKLAQKQTAKPKKKSFVEKVMPWLNLTQQAAITGGMVYGAIKGDFWGLGMFGGNWAYNNNNIADMAGLGYTNLANSALWSSQLGSNNDLWSSMGLNFTGVTGGAASAEKTALTTAQNKVDTIIANAGKTTSTDDVTPAQQKQAAADVEAIRKELTEGDKATELNSDNLAYLNEHFPPSKDSSEYTEEEIAIINQMKATPYVPVESIDIDNKGEKPISKEFAAKINKFIAKYYNDEDLTIDSDHYKKISIILANLKSENIEKYTKESIIAHINWLMTSLNNNNAGEEPDLVLKS